MFNEIWLNLDVYKEPLGISGTGICLKSQSRFLIDMMVVELLSDDTCSASVIVDLFYRFVHIIVMLVNSACCSRFLPVFFDVNLFDSLACRRRSR